MPVGQGPLAPFFSIFGVDASFGASTAKVILDDSELAKEGFAEGDVLLNSRVIEFPTTTFPTLTEESVLTVQGVSYRVHEVRKVDDGATRRALIVPVD